MRNSHQLFKLKGTAWSLVGGLLLAGLLVGCNTPLIDVSVQVDTTCSSGNTPSGGPRTPLQQLPKPGACQTKQLTTRTDANEYSNNNAWDLVTNKRITDHTHFCNTNTTKCQSSPGSKVCSGFDKPCMTKWTNGSCICGCPP